MQTIDMHRSWGCGGGGAPRPAGKTISLKIFFAHYMILRVYTVMVSGGLVEVWVVWGVSMDRTTVMLIVKWQGK